MKNTLANLLRKTQLLKGIETFNKIPLSCHLSSLGYSKSVETTRNTQRVKAQSITQLMLLNHSDGLVLSLSLKVASMSIYTLVME
jgi:hypothetical protein